MTKKVVVTQPFITKTSSNLSAVDILILANGPGEVTTWVRPVVRALREQLGNDDETRISIILSPCPLLPYTYERT